MNRTPLRQLALLAALAFALNGCDHAPPATDQANAGDAAATDAPAAIPNLAVINEGDPELVAAMQTARETLDGARVRWQAASPEDRAQQYFVKFFVEANNRREHLWLSPQHWSPFRIEGILLNEPRLAANLKAGDLIDIPIEQVEDWLIRMPERTDGGFTLAVLKKHGRGVRLNDQSDPP